MQTYYIFRAIGFSAITFTSSADVLEAKIAPCLHMPSNCLKISFLRSMFSNTASIIMSWLSAELQLMFSLYEIHPFFNLSLSNSSFAALFLIILSDSCQSLIQRCLSFVSTIVTGMPTFAIFMAIPPPISPCTNHTHRINVFNFSISFNVRYFCYLSLCKKHVTLSC